MFYSTCCLLAIFRDILNTLMLNLTSKPAALTEYLFTCARLYVGSERYPMRAQLASDTSLPWRMAPSVADSHSESQQGLSPRCHTELSKSAVLLYSAPRNFRTITTFWCPRLLTLSDSSLFLQTYFFTTLQILKNSRFTVSHFPPTSRCWGLWIKEQISVAIHSLKVLTLGATLFCFFPRMLFENWHQVRMRKEEEHLLLHCRAAGQLLTSFLTPRTAGHIITGVSFQLKQFL